MGFFEMNIHLYGICPSRSMRFIVVLAFLADGIDVIKPDGDAKCLSDCNQLSSHARRHLLPLVFVMRNGPLGHAEPFGKSHLG